MAAELRARRTGFVQRWLDPVDRLAEGIYGVLILMTFTMAFQATTGGETVVPVGESLAVRGTLLAAIGCTIAWGLIDGVMYIFTSVVERAERVRLVRQVQAAPSTDAAIATIGEALDEQLAPVITEEERRQLYGRVYERVLGLHPATIKTLPEDYYGAIATVLVAIVATLPAVIPFLFFADDPWLALRVSNVIAIGMLFLFGYRWARYVGARPVRVGMALALIGVAMVAVAIPLGG